MTIIRTIYGCCAFAVFCIALVVWWIVCPNTPEEEE